MFLRIKLLYIIIIMFKMNYLLSFFTRVSNMPLRIAGTKNITVNYTGLNDTFNIPVVTPTITLSTNTITLFNGDADTLTFTTS